MSFTPRFRRGTLGLAGAALLGAAPVGGCYRYVPAPVASVPPTEEVQVRLTPDGTAHLSGILGTQTNEVEGQVSPRGDSLIVRLVVARAYRGLTFDSSRQAFTLGPSEVASVRRREFSRGRTAVAAAGIAVGFAALVGAIVAIADPNPGSEEALPPPPPPAIRFPFSFRISFP